MINAARQLRPDIAILHRTAPFALFMAFIAIDEALHHAAQQQWLTLPEGALYYLYPVKTITVALLLYQYRDRYRELDLRDLRQIGTSATVCLVGLATFVIWVSADWAFSLTAPHSGFNPQLLPGGPVRVLMTAIRVAGAVLVVPLMEEIFWRSFLLRYLIDADFESVPLARFTWGSFLITTVLFGLEHQLIVAGMVAGAIYSTVIYKTRSLAQCVLAHAVTNLALACYVLYTGKWHFW